MYLGEGQHKKPVILQQVRLCIRTALAVFAAAREHFFVSVEMSVVRVATVACSVVTEIWVILGTTLFDNLFTVFCDFGNKKLIKSHSFLVSCNCKGRNYINRKIDRYQIFPVFVFCEFVFLHLWIPVSFGNGWPVRSS